MCKEFDDKRVKAEESLIEAAKSLIALMGHCIIDWPIGNEGMRLSINWDHNSCPTPTTVEPHPTSQLCSAS